VLVVKGGSDEKIRPVAECVLSHRLECSLIPLSIDFARQDLKKVKEILGDKEIDVFSYARLPSGISKEQVFKNLATLKKEGLFREAGASELSASTLEIMHKVRLTPLGPRRTKSPCSATPPSDEASSREPTPNPRTSRMGISRSTSPGFRERRSMRTSSLWMRSMAWQRRRG